MIVETAALTDRLTDRLKALRLPAVRACYEEQADLARREALSYEGFLLELLERECESRHEKRIARYLRQSKLPLEKSFDAFDRSRLPDRVNGQVSALLGSGFLDRRENVLAFGNPGSGKTHLLCAIAQELIYQGRRVLFRPCSLLVQQLLLAKRELVLPKLLARLARYEALVIDDIGYVQQPGRNGGALHAPGRALRTWQRATEQ